MNFNSLSSFYNESQEMQNITNSSTTIYTNNDKKLSCQNQILNSDIQCLSSSDNNTDDENVDWEYVKKQLEIV